MKMRFRRLDAMRLEDRVTPSAGYLPPSVFLFDPSQFESVPSKESPLDIARSFLATNAEKLGATPADFADTIITSSYTDADNGITHFYFRQTINGLPVANADMNVHVAADGSVTSAGGGFVKNLAAAAPLPVSSPLDALTSAGVFLGESILPESFVPPDGFVSAKVPDTIYQASTGVEREVLIATHLSLDPVPAKLQYVPNAAGGVDLAWNLVVRTTDSNHWYNLHIVDGTGDVAAVSDWIDDAGYNVVPLPNESPVDGGFTVLADPHLPSASPFGWHDTNGSAGAEFTDTRGNNVQAQLDRDANNTPDTSPPRPAGTSALNFSGYIYDTAQSPTAVVQNQNSAMVNLFYMNNMAHDLFHAYGFTSAAGGFQTSTYGTGGSGNDAVQADAQDASDTNNANFGTPPDGQAPRMQMFVWTDATPDRDSDLDNGVIIHEYGHGVSNRLTAGPAIVDALNTVQSGGMGEGWGDWWGLMFQQRSTDTANGGYGIGTYLLGQSITGGGIRAYRYSNDMALDPIMWDSYGTSGTTPYGLPRSVAVHRSGTIWASTLWDMNWELIRKYGFDSNLSTGWSASPGAANAGNKLALRLVMDALKLQPADPSFVQARDAILEADTNLTGGANHLQIWTAFARRGLGFGAVDNGTSSQATLVNDTTIPAAVKTLQVTGHTPADLSVSASTPTSFTLTLTDPIDALTVEAADFSVNGLAADAAIYVPGSSTVTFTFLVSPVTASGLQTMTLAAGSIARASDAAPIQAFAASFRYDPVALTVTSTSPTAASVVAPPLTTFDVNFSEAVLPASVSVNDLRMNVGYATAVTFLNGNTTARFTITGLANEAFVTATIPAGLITDVSGNVNTAFSSIYTLDYATRALTLAASNPAGSQVSSASIAGVLHNSGDVDEFTLTLAAGQAISAALTPQSTLRAQVTILTPASTTLATITAGSNGADVATTLAVAPADGTYTIRVQSAGGTSGTFTLEAFVNAVKETELLIGTANNTAASAQALTLSALGDLTRAAVVGSTDAPSPYTAAVVAPAFEDIAATGTTILGNVDDTSASFNIPFGFNFYGSNFTTIFPNSNGLITFGAGTTSNQNGTLTSVPSEAAIAVMWDDLDTNASGVKWQVLGSAGSRRVVIQWENVRYYTEPGDNTDEILRFQAILYEGTNEIRLNYLNLDGNVSGRDEGVSATVGVKPVNGSTSPKLLLASNAASIYHGTNKSTLISPPQSVKDFYTFTAAAGDTATLVAAAAAATTVELFDTNGTSLLATGATGQTNYTSGVQSFVIPAAGTYYAAVSSATIQPYALNVLLDAGFDRESNNTSATANPLGNSRSVLGSIASGNDDWYSLILPTGSTALKAEAVATITPTVQIYAANGTTLLASDGAVASGLTPGSTYLVRVSATATADYRLDIDDTPLPTVQTVVVNSGDLQRSRLTRIDVTFDFPYLLVPGEITLTRTDGGLVDSASGLVATNIGNVLTLTFDTGAAIESGSLADGRWQLAIPSIGYTSVLNDPNLRRLFGDANGDGTVDGPTDFAAFGNVFGVTLADSPFDYDGNGTIDGPTDFAQFGGRFGVTI